MADPAEDLLRFTSRRETMTPDELRALNDDLAMQRFFRNLEEMNAKAAAAAAAPRPAAPAGLGDQPQTAAPSGAAGLDEPRKPANQPDAPTRAPGPPVKDVPDLDGLGLDYTGRLKQRYGPVDALLPPLAAYKAWGNITNRPLAKLYPELSWVDRVFPTEKRRIAEANVADYLTAEGKVADRGVIEREIRDRYKPELEKLKKDLAKLDPLKRTDVEKIAETTTKIQNATKAMEAEILALGDVTPEDVRAPAAKGIEGNRKKFWKDVKGKAKVGAAGLATLGTGIAGTIAYNAIRRAGEEEGGEAAADAIARYVTGGEITPEDEALVRGAFSDDEFKELSIERSKTLMSDALTGGKRDESEDPLFFSPVGAANSEAGVGPAPAAAEPAAPVPEVRSDIDFGDLTDRYATGKPVTADEVAYLAQFISPETMDELTRYRDMLGGDMSPRAAGETRQQELRDLGYDVPDYAVPEVVEAPSTLTAAEVADLARNNPDALVETVTEAGNERQLDRVRNFVDAGIQNFASALGLPTSVQAGLRNAAEGARSGETADVVPDNVVTDIWDGYSGLWSDYVANPYRAWKEGGDPENPELLRRPAAWVAQRLLPEDMFRAYEDYGIGEFLDPVNYADMILGTTSDELGQGAYNLAREGLTALEAEGTTPRNFAGPYREILQDLGGQPLRYPEERRFDAARVPMDPRLGLPAGGMPAAGPGPLLPPGPPYLPGMGPLPGSEPAPAFIEPTAPEMPALTPEPDASGFDLGSLTGFGPAYAAESDEEAQAREEAVNSVMKQNEVLYPVGQTDEITRPRARPSGLTVDAPPAVDVTVPEVSSPTSTGGAVGDLNSTRASIAERGVAGLADDAEAAEEELNWINRMMRDKLGMTDASERAKAAEALISFGSTVLASRGDDWQAIGEGIQAGYGTVSQINDEEAAALAAQQEAILEENRWRQEMALRELAASRGGGAGGMPADIQKLEYLTGIFFEQLMASGELTPEQAAIQAQQMATDRVFEMDAVY